MRELAKAGYCQGLSSTDQEDKVLKDEDIPEDAIIAATNEMKEQHKINFERLNFPHGVDAKQERSKHHTSARVTRYIRILQLWNTDRGSLSDKEKKEGYTVVQNYKLRKDPSADGTHETIALMRKETASANKGVVKWLRVVPNHEIFYDIYEAHIARGHARTAITFNAVRERDVYTTAETDVSNYIATCPVCITSDFRLPKQVGAKCPIESHFFRDRFQVDLIDFQNNVGIGASGVRYKWCMALKDHFTRLLYLRALRTKSCEETSEELSHIFGLLGYPLVFHTDNGLEFTADMVLKAVKEFHPDCWTVQGQPRNPREQGSIERSHVPTKTILLNMVEHYKRIRPTSKFTWVQFLGVCMGCSNSSKSHGRGQTAPYSHVFVQKFRFPTSVSTSRLRTATTPQQLSNVLGDSDVTKRLERMGELGGDNEEQDSQIDDEQYISDVMNQFHSLVSSGKVTVGEVPKDDSLNESLNDHTLLQTKLTDDRLMMME